MKRLMWMAKWWPSDRAADWTFLPHTCGLSREAVRRHVEEEPQFSQVKRAGYKVVPVAFEELEAFGGE